MRQLSTPRRERRRRASPCSPDTGWNPRAAAARRRSLFLAERETTVAQDEAAVPKEGEGTDSLAPVGAAVEERAAFELGVLVGTPAVCAASWARKEAISLA
ncbi:hypothetical protein G6F62_014384 [Rhizopus arrhizus]|nr:hypothetical protein G6F62_014384 [Rhizopus arrhizus]KAG1357909.1 hypothetical protein G6F61_014528 [Rhizopus arrhizus]